MWNCPECGCGNIAEGIDFCPHCFEPRPTDVPAESEGEPTFPGKDSKAPPAHKEDKDEDQEDPEDDH